MKLSCFFKIIIDKSSARLENERRTLQVIPQKYKESGKIMSPRYIKPNRLNQEILL